MLLTGVDTEQIEHVLVQTKPVGSDDVLGVAQTFFLYVHLPNMMKVFDGPLNVLDTVDEHNVDGIDPIVHLNFIVQYGSQNIFLGVDAHDKLVFGVDQPVHGEAIANENGSLGCLAGAAQIGPEFLLVIVIGYGGVVEAARMVETKDKVLALVGLKKGKSVNE